MGIIVEGAFIGRLMTITVGDFGPRIGTALALGVVDIFMRATYSRKRKIVEWIKPKILTCEPCQETVEDKVDDELERDLRAAYGSNRSSLARLIHTGRSAPPNNI